MSQGHSIVGAISSQGARDPLDFYPTPAYATEALLSREKFEGRMWEPACGDGAISKVLINHGYEPQSSDLVDRGYGQQIDFLKWNEYHVENIITNPPFNLSLEFINHSKKCASKKIAMFLKTTFLESDKRYSMFIDKEFPLKTMYQFCKRVNLYKGSDTRTKVASGMIAFAWFVWDKDYVGKPTIEWIK